MKGLKRIVVIGVTGAGKTTFARDLAARLGYRHIEMDAVYWLPNWVESPIEQFRQQIAAAVTEHAWVIDGNYSKVRDIVWTRADTVIWLDYRLPLILWRLIRRTLHRTLSHEELWNGNRERLRNQLSRDSLILWALSSYGKHQRTYPTLFQQEEYAHLTVIRLRSPQAANAWLRDCP
jgi:adenylate kinase family enzyme